MVMHLSEMNTIEDSFMLEIAYVKATASYCLHQKTLCMIIE